MNRSTLITLAALSIVAGPAMAQDEGLGLTPEQAIEVCRPAGEQAYLDRLRCADGSIPEQNRVGSMGERYEPQTDEEQDQAWDQAANYEPLPEGVKDFHVLNMHTLECGDQVHALYFDIYHCDAPAPDLAPPGLSLAPDEAAALLSRPFSGTSSRQLAR